MRLHYYYRLLGFLVVFVFAMSTNYLLEHRGKCSDQPSQNPQAEDDYLSHSGASGAAAADNTAEAQGQQGVVLLEGPKTEPAKISAGQYPQSLRAEDLYKASVPAVKAILEAQNKFFTQHQKYADNLAQLNLQLLPAQTQENGSIQSDFDIKLGANYIDTAHYAFPISQQENYGLRFYYNNQASCLAKEAAAGNTCQILAGEHHPDICLPNATKCAATPQSSQPVIRNITADYTEYALPPNFLEKL